ncbi:hypothetical protein ACFL1H_04465 [Nanoarchaeota archaeon]
MKCMIFDAGPVISLTMNNLLWLLKPLKRKFGGEFCIPLSVKKELVDRPIRTKRFKYEALQVMKQIKDGHLKVIQNDEIRKETFKLLEVANQIVKTKDEYFKLVHFGEMEAIALANQMGAETIVVDERTTRLLIEEPEMLEKLMRKKLHTKVTINDDKLKEYHKLVGKKRFIRSIELVTIAYEMGLLNEFLPDLPHPKKELLSAILWGVKLDGCAVSVKEINSIERFER